MEESVKKVDKTGEGGGYRAELRTLLPNGKIKGRMS